MWASAAALPIELGFHGVDPEDSPAIFQEVTEMLKGFASDVLSHSGMCRSSCAPISSMGGETRHQRHRQRTRLHDALRDGPLSRALARGGKRYDVVLAPEQQQIVDPLQVGGPRELVRLGVCVGNDHVPAHADHRQSIA
jgi:hypothetical protein